MAVPLLNALTLARDALAVGAIAFGLSQCFAGLKLYDQIRRLPGALAGLVLAGLAAWFLWGDPLPTITAAALGAVAGWWVIGAYDDLILRGSAAAVGALVGAGIAALLVLVLQISLSPSALLALVLAPTILAAALAVPYRNLIITLATGFGGAALVVGGAAWLTLRVSAQQPDPGFFAVTLLGWLALGVVGVLAQWRSAGPDSAVDDGTTATKTKTTRVYRNPLPPVWDRPRPAILRGAVPMKEGSVPEARFDPRWISDLFVDADGACLAVAAQDGFCRLVDAVDGRLRNAIPVDAIGCVSSILLARGSRWLATIDSAHNVTFWNPNSSQPDMGSKSVKNCSAYSIAMSSDERTFAAAIKGFSGALATGLLPNPLTALAQPPELAVVGTGHSSLDKSRKSFRGVSAWRFAVAFHPGGDWIALLDQWHRVFFYDPDQDRWLNGKSAAEAEKPAGAPFRAGWPPFRFCVGTDGKLYVPAKGHVEVLSTFRREARAGSGGELQVKEALRLRADAASTAALFHTVALSPDGRFLAASGDGALISIWDLRTAALVCELDTHVECRAGYASPAVDGLRFHPNGRWLFTGDSSGMIRRWTFTEDGRPEAECDLAMEALPDGNWVVWKDPDTLNRRWVKPSPAAQRWLGWQLPNQDGRPAEYLPFDAFPCV